jgi:putative ABC transport system substrate-binding protein
VRSKVDVMLTQGTQAATAAKQMTSEVPIVATVVGDPVGSGLVASLAQPGGNVTALSIVSPDMAAKRLELLREAVPRFRHLAVLVDASNPVNVEEARQAEAAAGSLGLEAFPVAIRRAEDIVPAFDKLEERADALFVVANPLVLSNIVRINILAAGARLPTSYIAREYVQAGGLLSYGPSFSDIYRRAGDFIDKILRGTKPGTIPVEQPTKFDLVINLTTARALRVTIPPMLLARADEVIE